MLLAATPALFVVGLVDLLGGVLDIVAPKRALPALTPAEAAVLPLIGTRPLSSHRAPSAPILFNRPLQSNPRPHSRRPVRAAERAHTA